MTTQTNNRAVIYARFSSNNQREESIDAQIRECTKYAENNGYVIVNSYCDSAKSGTSAEREQFQKMVTDSEEQDFSYVIVHKLDRFSRDKYDSVHYKKRLRNNNVRVVSCLEHLSDDPESIILESVLEGMSQYYSANLSREVMKGLKENAYKCKHTGGMAPLGFDVEKETLKYVINEEEAEIVRKIFTMYAGHHGYSEILEHLNKSGYKTKLGRPFSKSSLNAIIKNEKYRGIYVYNRKKEFDFNRKRRPTLKSESEVIRIEDGMPRIISDDLFFKANHLATKKQLKSGTYNAKHHYLLSGLIKCGECGASLSGNSRTGGRSSSMYSSYRCSTKTNKKAGKCNCKEIRKEYIEHFVLDELNDLLFSGENVKRLTELLSEQSSLQQRQRSKEMKVLSKELTSIDMQISNTISLVTSGSVVFETVKGNINALEERKEYITRQLETLALELNDTSISLQTV